VTARTRARYALAAIRLFNGGAALFTPEKLARRLGTDPEAGGAVIYALRMFGVRTIVIGAELLFLRDKELERALRNGVLIHASDTVAAAAAGAKGYLPPRTAALTTLISTVNTGLAIAAKSRRRSGLAAVVGASAALGTGLAIGTLARRKAGGGGPAAEAGGYRQSLPWRLYDGAAEAIDRSVGWDKLPTPLGLAVLVGLRNTLRKRNLHDTSGQPAVNLPPLAAPEPRNLTRRTIDGSYNDLDQPRMGMAGSRFGRNVPVEHTFPDPDPLGPSPREVSRALLTRHEFVPAESVNALVAAWLQWMIRDWFGHGHSPVENPWLIPLAEDDPWPQSPMQIMRTRPDPTRPPGPSDLPPTYANTETPWWDASQIYGTTVEQQRFRRSGEDGKLRLDPDGLPPVPTDPAHNPAMVPGFWLGLAMLQALFTLEHNAICDRLRAEFPSWSDDELFEKARLVNAALIAKIHTTEWTPAVISHPTTQQALRANWWGLAGERLHNLFGRLSDSEIVSGIPGSQTQPQHYGVPYSLTEEFVAVYRMHPLVPDDYDFRSAADDHSIQPMPFRDLTGPAALEVMAKLRQTDLLYTFGTMHPGLVSLHNFPRDMQRFVRPDGQLMDLGAVDILRSRELGVPRYNAFRRLMHLDPAEDFDSLTDNPVWAEEIRRVYSGDIEAVDLSVGMFAEPKPKGFAFSDTAFRIFVLMASRRLNSDRFFTRDYTPQVYSQAGLDWIDDNTMATVLLRHHPELGPAMRSITNAFEPWAKARQP
jgi:Animal haem peroxidase